MSTSLARSIGIARSAARHRLRPGAVVLLYHRVAHVPREVWGMAVPPERFASQMRILRRYARPIPLAQLADEARRGVLPPRSVAVTFDDGYVDNLTAALPILDEYGIPATIFAVGMGVHGDTEFWWDELERIVMDSPTLPATLSLDIAGQQLVWASVSPTDETSRRELLDRIRTRLQQALYTERRNALDALHRWTGSRRGVRQDRRPMTSDELRQLSAGGSVEIGAHTTSHPSMSWLGPADQANEITVGKRYLEDVLQKPVRSFSYPFGELGRPPEATDAILREAGISVACTSERRTMRGAENQLRLPRYTVGNWSSTEFFARLAAWMID